MLVGGGEIDDAIARLRADPAQRSERRIDREGDELHVAAASL